MTHKQRQTEHETERMYRDYLTGMSCAAIGRKYHYDAQTVWSRFKKRGWETRPVSANNRKQGVVIVPAAAAMFKEQSA